MTSKTHTKRWSYKQITEETERAIMRLREGATKEPAGADQCQVWAFGQYLLWLQITADQAVPEDVVRMGKLAEQGKYGHGFREIEPAAKT